MSDFTHSSDHALRAALFDRWPELTDDDIERAGYVRELLVVRIVERCGISVDWCERHFADWAAENDIGGRIVDAAVPRRRGDTIPSGR